LIVSLDTHEINQFSFILFDKPSVFKIEFIYSIIPWSFFIFGIPSIQNSQLLKSTNRASVF